MVKINDAVKPKIMILYLFFSRHCNYTTKLRICKIILIPEFKLEVEHPDVFHDHSGLLKMGSTNFRAHNEFKGFGKGIAFASRILGKTIQRVTRPILHEIADALGFS